MIIVAACFAFCSYATLVCLNRLVANGDPTTKFLLLPDQAIWVFFPVFGGISLAWELTIRLWALFGNEFQARNYEAWTNQKAGFNTTRLLRLLFLWIGLPAALCKILALPLHTSLTDV